MAKRQKLPPTGQKLDLDWKNTTCATIYGPADAISIGGKKRHIASSDDETTANDTTSLLQQLLDPMDLKTFIEHCFRSCAVHAKSSREHKVNRYHSLIEDWLFDLDPLSIFKETSSESIFVWLQQPETGRIHSIEVGDPESAYRLYEAGHATYCRAPPALEQTLVRSLLADTGLGCGQYDPTGQRTTTLGRGEVEVFLSRTAGHVTNWHYDFQENFTLQLSGVKRWTIQKGSVRHPLRGCTPHYNAPEAVESQLLAARLADPSFRFGPPETGTTATGPIETIELHPGDCFYFPAGMWHKIEVIEPGVSINVSLMATNYATVTCRALQHLLLQRDEWRECVQGGALSVERLQSLLRKLPEIVRDFVSTQGAGAILPPCTLQPPKDDRRMAAKVEESMDDDDEESMEEEGEDKEAEEEEEEDEAGEDPPIVVSSFEAALVKLPLTLRTEYCKAHRLVVNPLARLLREQQDILHPYGPADHSTSESPSSSSSSHGTTFILNVNFAGNEAHESLVRQPFVVSSEALLLDMLEQLKANDGSLSEGTMSSIAIVRLVDFLVHYGYLQWKKK